MCSYKIWLLHQLQYGIMRLKLCIPAMHLFNLIYAMQMFCFQKFQLMLSCLVVTSPYLLPDMWSPSSCSRHDKLRLEFISKQQWESKQIWDVTTLQLSVSWLGDMLLFALAAGYGIFNFFVCFVFSSLRQDLCVCIVLRYHWKCCEVNTSPYSSYK